MLEGDSGVMADSPSAEVQSPDSTPDQSSPQAEPTSAETQNTDIDGRPPKGYVPLAALHEAREQLKALKESQDWQGYQVLKNALDVDPNFQNHFQKSVFDYYQQRANPTPQQDPYANYPQEIADPLRTAQAKIPVLEQTVQHLLQQNQVQQQQAVYGQYVNQLNSKLTDSKVPDHWKDFYTENVRNIAAGMNPNALSAYDQTLLDRAFEMVDQKAKSIQRAERGAYVVDKSRDVTPASSSTTGVAPKVNQSFGSQQSRVNMISELLKASR